MMTFRESVELLSGVTKQVHTQSISLREDTMDQLPALRTPSESPGDTVRARRGRMRTQARGLRLVPEEPDVFLTPQWLERSFVLPLTEPEATDVPSQPVPHHDDFERSTPAAGSETEPVFVRPPSREIDFARVIKRSDLGRTASRAAIGAIGIAGLVLIAYLLVGSPVLLGTVITLAVIALAAVVVRIRLAAAPIPYVET